MNIREKLKEVKNAIEELDTALAEGKEYIADEMKFSYHNFLNKKVAVWCETEEDSQTFLAYLMGKGDSWRYGGPLTRTLREDYSAQTCYSFRDNVRYANKKWYESEGYVIIKFNFDMLAEADDD